MRISVGRVADCFAVYSNRYVVTLYVILPTACVQRCVVVLLLRFALDRGCLPIV